MIIKEPKKTNFVRQLLSSISEKYNGHQTISIEYVRKERKFFKPIDIIYKLTKNPEKSSLCYFTADISKAYHNLCSTGNKIKQKYCVYQCYYCNKFFKREERQKRHTESCSGVPGVIYNFNTKTLISFQDNFNSKGDLPFVLYYDFETTAPTDNIFDPEPKKMFVVSYVLIVAFHPALNLDRIIIQRSYSHYLEELTTIKYLNDDQMKFIDLNQLKDIANGVSKRKCKNTMWQMFCDESAFVKKTLLQWFN